MGVDFHKVLQLREFQVEVEPGFPIEVEPGSTIAAAFSATTSRCENSCLDSSSRTPVVASVSEAHSNLATSSEEPSAFGR